MANQNGDGLKVTNFREPWIVFYYFTDNGITQDKFEK